MSRILSILNSRHWSRYLLDILAFVMVLAGLEYAIRRPSTQEDFGISLSWGTSTQPIAVLQRFSEVDPPDMIVVGSSVAQTSIMPRRLSEEVQNRTGEQLSIINMGGNYLSPDLTYELITQLMAPIYTPKIILYPMFPLDLTVDTVERKNTYLLNSSLAQIWYDDALYTPALRPLILRSLWIQYSLNMATWLINDFHYAPPNDYRGFQYMERENLDVPNSAANFRMPPLLPNTLAIKRLDELLAWGESHDVFFILVPSPLPDSFVQSDHGKATLADFTAILQNLDSQYANVIFLDLLADSGLTMENGFYDDTHVNVRGAEAWTIRVAEALAQHQSDWQIAISPLDS